MIASPILLADTSEVFVLGLKEILRPYKNDFTVKEVTVPQLLESALQREQPQLLLSEVEFLDELSESFIGSLRENFPFLKIVLLTNSISEELVHRAIKHNLDGYLKKDQPATAILDALKAVLSGNKFYSPEITSLYFKAMNTETKSDLSEREMEILRYICKGRSNEQIADILYLSEKTIATHKKNIMRKAGVKKTHELLLWAAKANMVSLHLP